MFNKLYLSLRTVGASAACNYWSNLGSVHKVSIMAGWTRKWGIWNLPNTSTYCNTGVGGVFLPISKAIAILSSEQLQGCSLLSLLFLSREPYLHLQVSATTLSNERPVNTEPKSSKQTLTCINLSNHSTLFGHTSFLANQLLRRHLVMIMR